MLTKVALISALAAPAFAQSQYMTGLINTLRDNGLTALADGLASFNTSSLETTISTGNHTAFAPDNQALSSIPNLVGMDPSELQQEISYHFLSGLITTNDTSPDKLTVARTSLSGAPTVNLRTFHLLSDLARV
jgi:uncharacterized surface protein with fasciclin (FAS1) repeats